ncbi:substrate-binding domain-containing protein [Streptomyces sp. NBC_01089]|uniref:substrate-binding domain-containing protein n=1 Tax=Streptomyces sp. NBC_01089 TaxID=2903747 RepID=UPI00386F2172|nr:substrate-binding and VWA domain-containing protein [Streptomyces sp. NBC_01089]
MGRHSLPDDLTAPATRPRPGSRRRRTVAVATVIVLGLAVGTGVAARRGVFGSGPCPGSVVNLRMVASPDIVPAVRAAADRARKDHLESDGQCVRVAVTARDSYKVAHDLGHSSAEPGYQIWLPDSEAWVDRAQGTGENVPLTPASSIAESPVTLAMVPSAAKALGWPDKTYTWAGLTAAATGPGQVHIGAADPARSATGLLALSSIAQSPGGAPGGDTQDTQVAAIAKVLSQRISDADSKVLGTLAQDGPGKTKDDPHRNQALVLSEQAAYAHNTARGHTQRLRLFYPKDGTPQLDYPYTLVDESELTTDQSRAAMRFMAYLGERPSRTELDRQGFRTPDQPATASRVEAAGGRSPQPYTDASPEPPSEDVLDEALGMWTVTVQSARLTTVVDASGSMATAVPGKGGRTRMDITKASLREALAQFTPRDEIGLWDFATHLDGTRDYRERVPTVRLGAPVKGGGTQRDRLNTAFAALRPVPGGATGLYDTTLAAFQDARKTYVHGKFNAVVVLTDGVNEDDHSISRSALTAKLRELDDPARPVPLIMIAVGPDTDRTEVEQVAKATGGAGYQVSDPSQINSVLLKAVMEVGGR